MKITLNIEMPSKDHYTPEACPALSPEEQVRDALDEILSGRDSKREWVFVSKVYKDLLSFHSPSEKQKNLINMIKPVMSKFGYHGTSAE